MVYFLNNVKFMEGIFLILEYYKFFMFFFCQLIDLLLNEDWFIYFVDYGFILSKYSCVNFYVVVKFFEK